MKKAREAGMREEDFERINAIKVQLDAVVRERRKDDGKVDGSLAVMPMRHAMRA